MKSFKQKFGFLVLCGVVAVMNQNCNEFNSVENREIASIHSPSILDIDLPAAKARVGDRVFIASVFADVFLPHGQEITKAQAIAKAGATALNISEYVSLNFLSSDKAIVTRIVGNVLQKIDEFHGVCSFLDQDATCGSYTNVTLRAENLKVGTVASNTVTREGYRISTCNEVLKLDRAVSNVMFNITGKRNQAISKKHLLKIYDLFYPDQPIDEEAYLVLEDLVDTAVEDQLSNLNSWRLVIAPVCQSTGWQIP